MKPRKISRKALTTGHILIVDDHEVVRRGLRSLLSSRPEWTICGEAVDGLDAVEKAKTLRPAVVLMDISMPRMNGLDATRIIRRDLPESKVVIISQNDPAVARRQAEEVDASAYVAKSDLPRLLLSTVSKLLSEVDHKNGNGSHPAPYTRAGLVGWRGRPGAVDPEA